MSTSTALLLGTVVPAPLPPGDAFRRIFIDDEIADNGGRYLLSDIGLGGNAGGRQKQSWAPSMGHGEPGY